MKKVTPTSFSKNFEKVYGVAPDQVLIPECRDDEDELLDALENEGVKNRLSFTEGRIEFPEEVSWTDSGAAKLTLVNEGRQDIYFWVIELLDATKVVSWCKSDSYMDSEPWQ